MAKLLPLLLATTALGASVPSRFIEDTPAPCREKHAEADELPWNVPVAAEDTADELEIRIGSEKIVLQAGGDGLSFSHSSASDDEDDAETDSLFPHRKFKDIDLSSHTILEILNHTINTPLHPSPEDKRAAHLPIRKFARFANATQELEKHSWWTNLVEHEEAGVEYTLLVPDDEALTPRHRHGHHGRGAWLDGLSGDGLWAADSDGGAADARFPPQLLDLFTTSFEDEYSAADLTPEQREKLLKLGNAVLYYHSVPYSWTLSAIADRATLETRLPSMVADEENGKLGAWDRVRVSSRPLGRWIPGKQLRGVNVNFYAQVRGRSIRAKNGYIHTISKPLFPPLSSFREMLLFPSVFSTLTSSIFETNLSETLNPVDPYVVRAAEGEVQGMLDQFAEAGRKWTVFTPTNRAWAKVPIGLQAFLHAPHAHAKMLLKGVLAYHTLPDVHFHTDYHPSLEPYLVAEEEREVASDDPLWAAVVEGESGAVAFHDESNYLGPFSDRSSSPLDDWADAAEAHAEHPRRRYTVEHYDIPSALSLPPHPHGDWDTPAEDWVAQNVSLAVVKYRIRGLGRNRLARRLVVKSYRGKGGEAEWDAVIVPDVPVRAGALHLTSKVIVPPFRKWHDGNDDDEE